MYGLNETDKIKCVLIEVNQLKHGAYCMHNLL